MPNRNKPLDYVMCEGPSDAYFVWLYIEHQLSYKENFFRARSFHSTIQNSAFYYLEGANRDVLVCSCGGCSNIDKVFKEVVSPSMLSNDKGCHLYVIIDRDNKTDSQCLSLVQFPGITMSVNASNRNVIKGSFRSGVANSLLPCESYFSVIPASCSGAFENILIQALSVSEPEIVVETSSFVSHLSSKASRHIRQNRLKIKAELDIMLILKDPESFYINLKNVFSMIDLSDANIVQAFGFLSHLVDPV